MALGLVNGTLEPIPDPEYGETYDYHCKASMEDAAQCNGLGNCSIKTIRTPTGGNVYKDSDCKNDVTIQQMVSIDPF